MNKIPSEDILEVLKAIKEECSSTPCSQCRFNDYENGCVFRDNYAPTTPAEWLLNTLAKNMREWECLI